MSQYHASMSVTVRNSGPASSQYPNVARNTTDPTGTISFSNFSTGTRFFKSAAIAATPTTSTITGAT